MSLTDDYVTCRTCAKRKKPVGRDNMLMELCDSDCEGYSEDPQASSYWPGERWRELEAERDRTIEARDEARAERDRCLALIRDMESN